MGQKAMARTFSPGEKWVSGVVGQKQVLLTYLIQTDTDIQWKRHNDHLKERSTRSLIEP